MSLLSKVRSKSELVSYAAANPFLKDDFVFIKEDIGVIHVSSGKTTRFSENIF